MSGTKTGGPAFPCGHQSGITVRDYFAAKAMQYWLSLPIDGQQLEKASTEAYRVADAMLKAREQ